MLGSIAYIDILVNIVLALIMLGIGFSLTTADYKHIFIHPRSIIAALSIQIIGLPLVSFSIALLSGLPDEMKVGLVVVSLCASGASSNLITHLMKGNVALAISMTVFNSVITLITLPIITNLALRAFMGIEKEIHLPYFETILQIFLVTLVPASIGLLIRRFKSGLALGLEKPLKIILPVLLAAVFTLKIFLGESSGGTGISLQEGLQILPWVLLLNLAAMSLGFFGSRLIRLPFADQYTISIEVGLHNTALALLIAGNILESPQMEKPAVVYATFSFFTAVLIVLLLKRIFKK